MVCTSRLLLFHFLAFTAPEDNCHHDDNRMVAGQPLYTIYRFGSVLHRRTVKLSTPRGPCSLPSYSGNASSRLHRNTFILGRYALRPCRIGRRNGGSLIHCGELVGAASSEEINMVKSVQAVVTTFTSRSQRTSTERKRRFQLFKVLAKHGFADCFFYKHHLFFLVLRFRRSVFFSPEPTSRTNTSKNL